MDMNARFVLLRLTNIIITIVVVALGLRLFLKLFGANPHTTFVAWMYDTTDPLLAPFQGMFPSPAIETGFILEFSTLFAIFIYALAGWLLMEFIEFIADASRREKRSSSEDL